MVNLIACVNPDVADSLALCAPVPERLIRASSLDEIADYVEMDRPQSVLILSPDVLAQAVRANDVPFAWCASVAELEIPVVLACATAGSDLDAIRAISCCMRVDVWCHREEGAGESLNDVIASAFIASLSMAAWHSIRCGTTGKLDARAATISRALFRQPFCFARTRDVDLFGISATWYNRLLHLAGLAPFSVLRRIARILYAVSLHVTQGMTMIDIAGVSGCGSMDTLSREAHLFAGVSPLNLCTAFDAEELVARSVALASSQVEPANVLTRAGGV